MSGGAPRLRSNPCFSSSLHDYLFRLARLKPFGRDSARPPAPPFQKPDASSDTSVEATAAGADDVPRFAGLAVNKFSAPLRSMGTGQAGSCRVSMHALQMRSRPSKNSRTLFPFRGQIVRRRQPRDSAPNNDHVRHMHWPWRIPNYAGPISIPFGRACKAAGRVLDQGCRGTPPCLGGSLGMRCGSFSKR